MSVTCVTKDGKGVVSVSGSMTAATSVEFRESLSAWREGEPEVKNFVLNLGEVDLLDSAGLGAMMAALKRIKEAGGDMKIACLPSQPSAVFETTRSNEVFEVFETVDEAIGSFH